MAYTIKKDIVVPNGYVSSNSGYIKPFRQVHLHSTANSNSSVQNERDYLAGHYPEANYTHAVGLTNGKVDIRQVMNTNQGAWDVGGDWNAETYGAIEFVEGSIKSQADFNKAYPAYIWLARHLNSQAGNSDYTLDTSNTAGIKTHNYASKSGHGSDHTDPIAFLAEWGVSYNQLKKDIKNGLENNATKEGNKVYEHINGSYYKQGDKVKVKGTKSSYGSGVSDYVKQATGTIMAIGARPDKKSGYMYLVHFTNSKTGYDAIWHFNGGDLKPAK